MGWYPFTDILVIPTGATTGKRIVINGVNGTITMYDASDQVTGEWSATDQSITLFQPVTGAKIGMNATPVVFFNPDPADYDTSGYIDSFVGGSGGTQGILRLVSPYDSAGGSAANIDLLGGDGVYPTQIAIDAGDFTTNSPIHSTWNQAVQITADVGPILPGATANIVSANVIVPDNVFKTDTKITITFNGILSSGVTTDVLYDTRILRDGVQIFSARIIGPDHNQTDQGRSIVFTDIAAPPGAHTYTFALLHEAASTATNITLRAAASQPAQIMVEGI